MITQQVSMELRSGPGQASTLNRYPVPSRFSIPPYSQEEKEHSNPQGKASIERRTPALLKDSLNQWSINR